MHHLVHLGRESYGETNHIFIDCINWISKVQVNTNTSRLHKETLLVKGKQLEKASFFFCSCEKNTHTQLERQWEFHAF